MKAGDIKSASGRVKWAQCLEHHLIPAFGTLPVDQIRHADVATWRVQVAETINAGKYSPHTANTWLDVLRVVIRAAVVLFELPRNPMEGIRNFDTSEHVYTEEEPNSLTVEEMPRFLETMRELYPQHFGFVGALQVLFWGIARRRYDRCVARALPQTFGWTRGSCSSGAPIPRATR